MPPFVPFRPQIRVVPSEMPPQPPVELLRVIVDNFRLPPLSSILRTRQLEDETRSTLYSLCLTSRIFYEIAQPLLFHFVRIPQHNAIQTLSLLVQNNEGTDRLALVRQVLCEEHAGERIARQRYSVYVKKFYSLANRLEEVVGHYAFAPVEHYLEPGLTLKRLFLNEVRLDSMRMSGLKFPSLEILGLRDVILETEPFEWTIFPSLRHLVFDEVADGQMNALSDLLPQLDSIILMSDDFEKARPTLSPDFPFKKLLVHHPWCWHENHLPIEEDSLVNIRLLVSEVCGPGRPPNGPMIDEFTVLFDDKDRFPQLESIYLPPPGSLPEDYDQEDVCTALERLAFACRDRHVEVVFEEQADKTDPQCQVSEEFMRRMTKKRIARETGES
ncbi:uncharacterized protein JCM6883_007312 [Sporobolomyces salmoneus]|uniref:uncharacterized protein n=1 Tax=Sporobolomyces salmoneus TaxID=183962 RepID=UPI0031810356